MQRTMPRPIRSQEEIMASYQTIQTRPNQQPSNHGQAIQGHQELRLRVSTPAQGNSNALERLSAIHRHFSFSTPQVRPSQSATELLSNKVVEPIHESIESSLERNDFEQNFFEKASRLTLLQPQNTSTAPDELDDYDFKDIVEDRTLKATWEEANSSIEASKIGSEWADESILEEAWELEKTWMQAGSSIEASILDSAWNDAVNSQNIDTLLRNAISENKLPNVNLLTFADLYCNLFNDSKLAFQPSEAVKKQLYYAAHSKMLDDGTILLDKNFNFSDLEPQDIASLYLILTAYEESQKVNLTFNPQYLPTRNEALFSRVNLIFTQYILGLLRNDHEKSGQTMIALQNLLAQIRFNNGISKILGRKDMRPSSISLDRLPSSLTLTSSFKQFQKLRQFDLNPSEISSFDRRCCVIGFYKDIYLKF